MVALYLFWIIHMNTRIVILGGGFGGLVTALRLARMRVKAEIILIDAQPYHLYTPWLYRIPSDAWHNRMRRMCEFYYEALVRSHGDRVTFRRERVERVNTETQHVVFENGNTLHYNYLVIGLGSQVNFFGMRDIAARAHVLNTPEGVLDMHEQFAKLLKAAKDQRRKHVVIAGAGATGVEMTMELGALRKRHGLKELDITLIDAAPVLLQRFSPYIQRHAARRAKALGIRVLHKALVRGVRGEDIVIQQDGKESTIHADLLAWAGGVKPNAVIATLPYAKDDSGRLLVNDYLEVKDARGVLAVGDSASVWDSYNQCVVPPTAWAAVDQSLIVAHTLAARLQSQELTHRYIPPKKYPGVLALGGLYAAGGGYGLQISGIIGWIAKQYIHLQYFALIMPCHRAVRAWLTKKHICGSPR